MKSKSFDSKRNSSEKVKLNKTFDFSKYYTSAAETKTVLDQSPDNHVKENKSVNKKLDVSSKREHSPKKKKTKLEPLDISHIDIEGPSLNATAARNSLNESKLTSTPRSTSAKDNTPKVKSIMKNKSVSNFDEHLEASPYSPNKPKKRNKSVSFMLDDTEEVVVKKTKSNDSIDRRQDTPKKHETSKDLGKLKKLKFNNTDVKGKENKRNDNMKAESDEKKVKKSEKFNKDDKINSVSSPKPVTNKEKKEHKKDKFKKVKKQNSEEKMEDDGEKEESNNNENQAENKNRRAKKKKHSPKQNTETEMEGEPAAKSQKKEIKPEAIVENLESLSIGDNAHTLTNLLDEMTVAEKDKRKKHKRTLKKAKKQSPSTSSGDTTEAEKTEEVKEKVKWQKRKWNKDKKGDADSEGKSSIIVDNLPLSILCNYKKQLAEHFKKHGEVKSVGLVFPHEVPYKIYLILFSKPGVLFFYRVAEMYPAEDSKPVFTTTIHFNNKEAATEVTSISSTYLSFRLRA